MKIVIIKYTGGNVFSLKSAINRLGFEAIVTDDFEEIKSADKVIFPGVGEAKTAMNDLKSKGLDGLIVNLKQPFLGICLGMQLMCSQTEEGKSNCLGIFDVKVNLFPKNMNLKVPQMGWNSIENTKSKLFNGNFDNSFMYFVHSYYVPENAHIIALCNYGIPFSAALKKDNFYGTQFHPEKSGDIGEQVLKNFLELDN